MAEIAKNEYPPQDLVLAVLTSPEHMMSVAGNGPMKNVIHGMVKLELGLDNYYLPQLRTILIRVQPDTIENPILKEW